MGGYGLMTKQRTAIIRGSSDNNGDLMIML